MLNISKYHKLIVGCTAIATAAVSGFAQSANAAGQINSQNSQSEPSSTLIAGGHGMMNGSTHTGMGMNGSTGGGYGNGSTGGGVRPDRPGRPGRPGKPDNGGNGSTGTGTGNGSTGGGVRPDRPGRPGRPGKPDNGGNGSTGTGNGSTAGGNGSTGTGVKPKPDKPGDIGETPRPDETPVKPGETPRPGDTANKPDRIPQNGSEGSGTNSNATGAFSGGNRGGFSASNIARSQALGSKISLAQGKFDAALAALAAAEAATPNTSSKTSPVRYGREPGDIAACGCLNTDTASAGDMSKELIAAKAAEAEAAAELAAAKAEARQFLESVKGNSASNGSGADLSIW